MLPTDYKARKEFPLFTFLSAYFPDAIEGLVALCVQGNIQHDITRPEINPFYIEGDRIAWDRAKSTEEMETLMRHAWDHMRAKRAAGGKVSEAMYDSDKVLHILKTTWRAMAEAQKTIEALRLLPTAPAPAPDLPQLTRAEAEAVVAAAHTRGPRRPDGTTYAVPAAGRDFDTSD